MKKWYEAAFAAYPGLEAPTLVVLVHGLAGTSAQLGSVAAAAVSALGAADVYVPQLTYGGLAGAFNSTAPAALVCELVTAVGCQ